MNNFINEIAERRELPKFENDTIKMMIRSNNI